MSASYKHPIFGEKTYAMLQDIDSALDLGIAYSADVMQHLTGARKFRNHDEWQIADKSYCIILGGYKNFIKTYIKSMAEHPRYFRLDYGKTSDLSRKTGFIDMPERLIQDVRADNFGTQQKFVLHQLFNFMSVNAKHLNEPLSRQFSEVVEYDPKLREARADGVRYATQFWLTILSKLSTNKNALDVAPEFGLPRVVGDDEPVITASSKRVVDQLKKQINGLGPSPFGR